MVRLTVTRQPNGTCGHSFLSDWTLGWRMQRALAHAGISVAEMADELEVSRGTLSRWLNDRGAPPRAIYLRQWALRCGVDYGWLTGNPDGRTSVSPASRGLRNRAFRPPGRRSFRALEGLAA